MKPLSPNRQETAPEEMPAFYPPRSRTPRRLRNIRNRWRRLSTRIRPPDTFRFLKVLLAMLIPGYGFHLAGARRAAGIALAAYALLALLYLAFLGYIVGALAGGLMIGLHATGSLYCLNKEAKAKSFSERAGRAVLIAVALTLCLYLPSQFLLSRIIYPLDTPNGIVVVNTRIGPEGLQRGDPIAYRIQGRGTGGYVIRPGIGVEQILGLPGDTVRFEQDTFSVNGIVQPALRGMPSSGEILVPEGAWFIWTNQIRTWSNTNPRISVPGTLLLAASIVQTNDLLGIPFEHWFWRRQIDEPIS